jgi:PmbA protein
VLKLEELKSFARTGAQHLRRDKSLAEFEIFCSSSQLSVARLCFTSDIPSRGVEELKTLSADGFALRIVPRGTPVKIGKAVEAGELSIEALRATLRRALSSAVSDPHFPGLPRDGFGKSPGRVEGGDLMTFRDPDLVRRAWELIDGAMRVFVRRVAGELAEPGLILGGDLTVTRDRIAITSSHMKQIETDQSAHFSASATVLIEQLRAKASATALGRFKADLSRTVPKLGAAAVAGALAMGNGVRPPAGTYRAILGPQPVAEILNYMVLPSLTTSAFRSSSSAYLGRFGSQVTDRRLSLRDDPRAARGALARKITCEGLIARRAELIAKGKIVGLLSNYYEGHRLAADEHRADKLGPEGAAVKDFPATSGYRLGDGGERNFDASLSTAGTNVLLQAAGGLDEEKLLRELGNGIYIGRVWYTYPINGLRAGDFTCTISGDSWMVENGKRAAPLAPNCLRLNAKIDSVFGSVMSAGKKSYPALVWGSPEAFYVPPLLVEGLQFTPVTV